MALTTEGLNFLTQAIVGQGTFFDANNAYIGVGNGGTAFNAAHVDLQGAYKFRKKVDSGYPKVNPPILTFKTTFLPEEANFPWYEWGVFNARTGGVMLNRTVESNGTKQNNQTWILEVDVEFTIGN